MTSRDPAHLGVIFCRLPGVLAAGPAAVMCPVKVVGGVSQLEADVLGADSYSQGCLAAMPRAERHAECN